MKKNMLLLLSALLLSSCGQQPTENPTQQPSVDPTQQPTSEHVSVEQPTSEEIEPSISDSQPQTPSYEVSTPFYKEKNMTHYLGSDNDIYRVNITTQNNEFPVDKENYVDGSLNISEQDSSKILHEEMDMRIKLRGNSTLGADKKPFKIKFDSNLYLV